MKFWKWFTGGVAHAESMPEPRIDHNIGFDHAPKWCAQCDRHYGGCMRCGHRWNHVKGHSTSYGGEGCFPLCEECWSALTPQERLPYYRRLRDVWMRYAYMMGPGEVEKINAQMPLIEAAVLAGE